MNKVTGICATEYLNLTNRTSKKYLEYGFSLSHEVSYYDDYFTKSHEFAAQYGRMEHEKFHSGCACFYLEREVKLLEQDGISRSLMLPHYTGFLTQFSDALWLVKDNSVNLHTFYIQDDKQVRTWRSSSVISNSSGGYTSSEFNDGVKLSVYQDL